MRLPSMVKIPALVLKQLYTFGSLKNVDGGVRFRLKNRLSDAKVTGIRRISVAGDEIALERVRFILDESTVEASSISEDSPLVFDLKQEVDIHVEMDALDLGKHKLDFSFQSEPFGKLKFGVEDSIAEDRPSRRTVPLDKRDNYSPEIIRERQRFAEEMSGAQIQHINKYSFDPQGTQGNVENFAGVAQVPIGFAGPIEIDGEHAKGEFLVPLATTEGTLVASYNRGIKVLNLSGGVLLVRCSDDCMQRAPVFVFDSAREARDFRGWVQDEHIAEDRARRPRIHLEHRQAALHRHLSSTNKFAYLQFQLLDRRRRRPEHGRAVPPSRRAAGSSSRSTPSGASSSSRNLATDKKGSQVNVMRTRGKRVTAEATIPRDVLIQHMRVEPESAGLPRRGGQRRRVSLGRQQQRLPIRPTPSPPCSSPPGQDVANVAESSAGIVYSELTPERDLYISITIPSLIVATYGGGTGLATQRECLELMDCYGRDRVMKLAEIIAGVVLAGDKQTPEEIAAHWEKISDKSDVNFYENSSGPMSNFMAKAQGK